MDSDTIYQNVQTRTIQNSTGPQAQNCNLKNENDRQQNFCVSGGRSRCLMMMVMMTVSLGLICVVLLIFITRQHINITAERDLFESTATKLKNTITSLQHNITSLRDELTEKKQGHLCGPVCVFITPKAKSWSDSRQYCRDQGADLVIIKSEKKQRLISSLVKDRVWIGLSDIKSEGNMKWVDNSPLYQGFWYTNEPNNGDGGDEDCIELIPADRALNNWNDLPCSNVRKAICEK